MNTAPWLRNSRDGTVIEVYVQPKAGRSEFAGVHEDKLKIRLSAPPVEGEANKECIRFLSKALGVPKSKIEIVHGHKSRHKTILIHELSSEALQPRLRELALL